MVFQAIRAQDDQADEEKLGQLGVTDYYKRMLKDAALELDDTLDFQDDSFLGDSKLAGFGLSLAGYVHSSSSLKKAEDVLHAIATQEDRYYYKWIDNGSQAKNSKKEEVLTRLQRVNVRVYNAMLVTKPKRGEKDRKKEIALNLPNQKDIDLGSCLPIAIGEYKAGNGTYFGIYMNDAARPFFLDTIEDTRGYHYSKKDQEYDPVPTFRYDKGYYDRYKEGLKEGAFAKYDFKNEEKRLLFEKVRYVNKYRSQNLKKNLKEKDVYDSPGTLFKNVDADLLKKADNYANDKRLLLPSGYRCFYFSNAEGRLCGFLSSVNIGVGGRGGGYAMRCDPVREVDYVWGIERADNELAMLLGRLVGLDVRNISGGVGKNEPAIDGHYATNWPYDKERAKKKKGVAGMDVGLRYYQKYTKTRPWRNEPQKPRPPRITNPRIRGIGDDAKWKKDFKLDNRSYRIWKKGTDWTGEALGQNDEDRKDAGSTMAEALAAFHYYETFMAKSGAGVTRAKLPATAFAETILLKDEDTKTQWAEDNDDIAQASDVSANSLKTKQEWCHLYGHGDGGREELGNFVAGSEHCNTEQLAIETGLRRITQSNDFDPRIKDNIKAKITAYLMPNRGAWVDRVFDKKEVDKLFKDAPNGWREKFFKKREEQKGEDTDTGYELKTNGELRSADKDLAEGIKTAKNATEKLKLINLRRTLRAECFMYLPLARYMRYKIYYKNNKIFDHVYYAQSESFDHNECKILDRSVEYAIYKAIGQENKYKEKLKARLTGLVLKDDQVEAIRKFIRLNDLILDALSSLEALDNAYEQWSSHADSTDDSMDTDDNRPDRTWLKILQEFRRTKSAAGKASRILETIQQLDASSDEIIGKLVEVEMPSADSIQSLKTRLDALAAADVPEGRGEPLRQAAALVEEINTKRSDISEFEDDLVDKWKYELELHRIYSTL